MKKLLKIIGTIIVILYIISPADLGPGIVIDDVIVAFIAYKCLFSD